jgi:hypothetical protein
VVPPALGFGPIEEPWVGEGANGLCLQPVVQLRSAQPLEAYGRPLAVTGQERDRGRKSPPALSPPTPIRSGSIASKTACSAVQHNAA